MAIEKLTEFAKAGQKDTDQLDLEVGFIVNRKPARQWFNWLFNTLTKKINEIIDADFIPRNEIIDDLTTNDSTKPVSAKQAKKLQEEKLAIADVVNDLTTGGEYKALSAEQGKLFFEMFRKSLSGNGYQKLPGGLIIQWLSMVDDSTYGAGSLASNVATFPIAFPNGALQYYITTSNEKFSLGCDVLSQTTIKVNALNHTTSPSIMARVNVLVVGH